MADTSCSRARLPLAGALALALALAGCGRSSSPSAPVPAPVRTATASVGPAGGTVTLDGVTVTIPADALAEPRTLTLTATAEAPPAGTGQALTPVYRLEPHGIQFARPIQVAVPYAGPETAVSFLWQAQPGFAAAVNGIAQVSPDEQALVTVENGGAPEPPYVELVTTLANGVATASVTHSSWFLVSKTRGVSAARSSFSLSPALARADGTPRATVSLVVRDDDGAPYANAWVQLVGLENGQAVSSLVGYTGAGGQVTFSLASRVASVRTWRAYAWRWVYYYGCDQNCWDYWCGHWGLSTCTHCDAPVCGWKQDPGNGQVLLGEGTLRFAVPATADHLAFTASPSSATAGEPLSPVSVAVLDAFGAPVPASVPISLALQGGAAGATLSGTRAQSPLGAEASWADLAVDLAGAGYQLVASSLGVTPAACNAFPVSHAAADRLASTLAAQGTFAVAGGPGVSLVVVARDRFGNPVDGEPVGFEVTGTSNALGSPPLTDGAGRSATALRSTRAEEKTIIALLPAQGAALPDPVSVRFVAAAPDPVRSGVRAAPSTLVADGLADAVLAVTVVDAWDNPVVGTTVSFAASGATSVVQPLALTDPSGVATGRAWSREAGEKTVSAVAGGVALATHPRITFTPAPPSAALSSATVTPASVGANGLSIATVAVSVVSTAGLPMPGRTVQLSATGTGNTVSPPATTGAAGGAALTIASTVAETKTLTLIVDPGPAQVALAAHPTVEFTTCPAGQVFCGTACVDLTSDSAHCGSCSNACGAGACSAGRCTSPHCAGTIGLPGYPLTRITGPTRAVVADVDGSGTLDLVVAQTSAGIAVARRASSVRFSAPAYYPTAQTVQAVVAADFTGDGRPDVAAVYASNAFGFLRNNGDGTFAARVDVTLGTNLYPRDAVAADVDLDGKKDLVVLYSDHLSVLRGNGNGTFQAAVDHALPAGDVGMRVVAASLGVAAPDLVVTLQGGQIVILRNGGAGTFPTRTAHASGLTPEAVAVGDVDGDGLPDLVVVGPSQGAVSVLLGQAGGGLASAVVTPVPYRWDPGARPYEVALANLDGGPRQEILVAMSQEGTFRVLRSAGVGVAALSVQVVNAGGASNLPLPMDLDGDGDLDLAVLTSNPGGVSPLLNDGTGAFPGTSTFSAGAGPVGLGAGDLDGDGRLDLAAATVAGVLLASGATDPLTPTTTLTQGAQPADVQIADLDGDGLRDVVALNRDAGTVTVHLQTSPGVWAPGVSYPVALTPRALVLADLDHDARRTPEIIVTAWGATWVNVLRNAGDGTFGGTTGVAYGSAPSGLVALDANGDGWTDLAVAWEGGAGGVSILTNRQGDGLPFGTFDRADVLAGASCSLLAAGDLGGAGRDDLVVWDATGGRLQVLINGGGTFSAGATVAVPGPAALAVVDLDGDGAADVVSSGANDYAVSVLYNTGAGATFRREDHASTRVPAGLAVADLTGDGWIDLAVANNSTGAVTVLPAVCLP